MSIMMLQGKFILILSILIDPTCSGTIEDISKDKLDELSKNQIEIILHAMNC
jgi:hypothetical protein